MQKWEGKSINCSENHSLLGLGSLERVTTWRYKWSRPGSQEKKTLLSFNSQKKTNSVCLSLWLLISLKTKPALRGTEAKRKGGEGQKLTFLLLTGSRLLATRPGKQDAKCPVCPQSLSSPGTATFPLWSSTTCEELPARGFHPPTLFSSVSMPSACNKQQCLW